MSESRDYGLDSTLSHSPDQLSPALGDLRYDSGTTFNFDLTPIFLDTEEENPYGEGEDTVEAEERCGGMKGKRVVCIFSSREISLSLGASSLYARRKATALHKEVL